MELLERATDGDPLKTAAACVTLAGGAFLLGASWERRGRTRNSKS